MTTTTLERAPLTIADRCDRCGAQAFIRELHPALSRHALVVQDATDTINAKPSPSANSD